MMADGAELFVICKSCGSEVSPYITECPYCGGRLRKRAPKLDRDGGARTRTRRGPAKRTRRAPRAQASRRARASRPYATALLLLAAGALEVAIEAGIVSPADVGLVGPLGGEPWRLVTAPFAYLGTGYLLVSLGTIALFGGLLERRRGALLPVLVFGAGAVAGTSLVAAVEDVPFALGGNGAALALLAAWAVPILLARRRGEEDEADLLGAAVIAGALLAMPLVAGEANALSGLGGALAGLLIGLPLSRLADSD